MPALDGQNLQTTTPMLFDYTHVGTAAGTTVISKEPAILHAITVNRRAASGVIVAYDSNGTSASVIGSIVLGTQTFSDANPVYTFNVRTKVGLTVSNTGDIDLTVAAI
jgi:hypothetical protein